MDEETMRKEFEKWAKPGGYFIELDRRGYYRSDDTRSAFEAWLESASRADKRAREECAEICEKDLDPFCAARIRATIKVE